MSIIGHEKIVSFLDKARVDGLLSHAYCFVGVDHIGKRKVAKYIAAKILNTTEDRLIQHPDFFCLRRLVDDKEGKLKKDIVVGQARDLINSISQRSWFGVGKVVIINEAETINKNAANSMLKIIESGDNKTIFFLLTEDGNLLLPTVRSRCQLINFFPLDENALTAGLRALGFFENIDECVALSAGRPGLAIHLASDSSFFSEYQLEVERLRNLIGSPLFEQLTKSSDLLEDKNDLLKTGEKWQKSLEIWQIVWRQVLLSRLNAWRGLKINLISEIISKSILTADQVCLLLDKIRMARVMLKQNVSPKILIEQLLMELK